MTVLTERVQLRSAGFCDIHDLTNEVASRLSGSGLQNGTVTVFVPGSTAGVTTIEYEPGLKKDLPEFFEKIAPVEGSYHHNATWGDGNGFSHVRAAFVGPSLSVPFTEGRLLLGTWQQIVLLDFDNGPRSREVVLQFLGE